MPTQVYISSALVPVQDRGPVITMGNYDGVHLGHQALIRAAVERARSTGHPAMVYTFDPPPREVLGVALPTTRVLGLADKIARFSAMGVDLVCVEPFSSAFASHSARWFATEVLVRRLGAHSLVVGHDFRFGRGRDGDAAALSRWTNLQITRVPPLLKDDAPVSSTRIRELLRVGLVEDSARLLGHPHFVRGVVVRGDQRGRTLGFPTANVLPASGCLPGGGVYAVRASVDGGSATAAVANIGRRPTFHDPHGRARLLEVHLLVPPGSIEDDALYGRELKVRFIARLRDEVRFKDPRELEHQILLDIEGAKEKLEYQRI